MLVHIGVVQIVVEHIGEGWMVRCCTQVRVRYCTQVRVRNTQVRVPYCTQVRVRHTQVRLRDRQVRVRYTQVQLRERLSLDKSLEGSPIEECERRLLQAVGAPR